MYDKREIIKDSKRREKTYHVITDGKEISVKRRKKRTIEGTGLVGTRIGGVEVSIGEEAALRPAACALHGDRAVCSVICCPIHSVNKKRNK